MNRENLKIEYIATDELKAYENNAKQHPEEQIEQIKASIRKFEMIDPIGIWSSENVIVEGHGRLIACQELQIEKVPVIRLDHLTDEERRAYALAHNQTTLTSGFDPEMLRVELKDIRDIDMEQFGFDMDALGDFEAEEDDYEVNLPQTPKTKIGQIWKLGDHRLMCGDATDPDAVRKLSGGVQPDLLLTDPPYNVDYTGGTKDHLKIQNDNMEDEAFRTFLRKAFKAADAVMKPGAAFYIWHADSEGLNFRAAAKETGWRVRQCIIWAKNSLVIGRQDYQWKHEPCLYGWKEGRGHYFIDSRRETTVIEEDRPDIGRMKKAEMRKLLEEIYSGDMATTVIHMDKPARNDAHPTMKPVKLFDYLIRNSTRKKQTVLDTFAGSGTAAIACEQNGRRALMMEYDPAYVDVIIDRWETFTGKKAELAEE